MGACLSPGWINSGYYSSCGRKTTVTNPRNGKSIHVVIIDACVSASCNDIMLTKAAFQAIGGNMASGHVDNKVNWYFDDQHK
ncbi:unnamed protein product [Tilletia controversa]|nr:unnamed protein product [Tilletia controversa]CAD6927841.1 unnamed protein product [Tilletia controversa]CAD6933689.1 unnamed protein product [Tilletia controversa]CAD6933693.1 unnamed protein product [Tilletia controversa]